MATRLPRFVAGAQTGVPCAPVAVHFRDERGAQLAPDRAE
jgi:hypothetical protein